MALVHWNHEIQAFATYGSDHSLAEGIGLRSPNRRFDGRNPEVLDRLVQFRRKDGCGAQKFRPRSRSRVLDLIFMM
jgi:hypothetical protein